MTIGDEGFVRNLGWRDSELLSPKPNTRRAHGNQYMKEKLFLAYFNVSLVCVLLVGLELIGQIVYVLIKGYPVYESDRYLTSEYAKLFELHPFLAARLRSNVSVREGEKVITTTANHTRWTGASTDDVSAIKIATVGGSTTFGAGVSDAESWPARLQATLGNRYSVSNYGMPGYSTAEAITQMALLVPESRPDLVVVYEGWNDLHNFHDPSLGSDYYSHGLRQYSNLAIQRPQPKGLFGKLVDVSAVCRLARFVSRQVSLATGTQDSDPEQRGSAPESRPDPFVERIYRRNLITLKVLAQQSGAYVLFIPQVLDESRLKGSTSSWWTPRIRNDAMPNLLRRMNLIMTATCDRTEARCGVLDAVAARKWQPDDFIDEGHFSAKGNEAFAQLVAARIAEDSNRHLIRFRTVQRVAWEPDLQLLHSHR